MKTDGKNNFYKLKKLEKEKNYFCWNLRQKGSLQNGPATKWAIPKKGHNKTGCAKVVVPKSCASTLPNQIKKF